MGARCSQSGYMMEVPLLMLAAGIVLAIALPHAPSVLGRILVAVGTLIWIGGLYYMILAPGWLPGSQPGMGRAWKWVLFLVLAGLLAFGAVAYIANAGNQVT